MLAACSVDDFWLVGVVWKRAGQRCLLARVKADRTQCRLRLCKKKYVDVERCRAAMRRAMGYSHPFLMAARGMFEQQNRLVLVTEDVRGRNLLELAAAVGNIPEKA